MVGVRPPSGALTGVVAAGAGLGVGEVVAGIIDRRSPIQSVGDRVVDGVPSWLKDFAISTFGTADKGVLLIGVGVVLAVVAALLGARAQRSIRAALIGAAVLGLVGVLFAVTGRAGRAADAVPVVAATLAGAGALWLVIRARPDSRYREVDEGGLVPTQLAPSLLARRQFFALGGVATGGALAVASGRRLQGKPEVAKAREALALPGAVSPLPPIPHSTAAPVPGATPFVTPNNRFYRIDTALFVPRVDVRYWKLRINGLVQREFSLTYDDLLKRDLQEVDCTLMCVSNEVGGDLIGHARWLGVPLAELLTEAGVKAEGTQVFSVSVDGFTAGFPTSVAMDGRDAIVALGMNGQVLPFSHGFPARLVIPGIYGYVSATKWLDTISLVPWESVSGYWIPRGWAKEAPIKTGSRIDVPKKRATIPPGTAAIAGVAWAQHRGVQKVEVQIDHAEWVPAQLATDGGIDSWRQWWVAWNATPGDHRIRVRATDGEGRLQDERPAPPAPDGATGFHGIDVKVRAA